MAASVADIPVDRSAFPDYSDEDLLGHYKTFCIYDIDSNGFITPENLLNILTTMEVKDASMTMVKSIVEEVGILTGTDNDGKLSFRDYMMCIKADHEAAAHNLALDAAAELRLSQREEEEESLRTSQREEDADDDATPAAAVTPPVELEPDAPKQSRMRQSSMAALAAVAGARIRAFQQVAKEATMAEKLNAFKSKGVDLSSTPMVNSDEMHKETLRNKVKAFETATRFKDKVELKKTWKQVGASRNYSAGVKIVAGSVPAGPPPKKKITDLP